jgi:hypothetical protein
MKLERNYTEEEKEFNNIFFCDELQRISDIVNFIKQFAYIYNPKEKSFIFDKKKVDLLDIEIDMIEKEILISSKNIYLFIEELHNVFLDKHRNNLNIGAYIDWTNKQILMGFNKQKKLLDNLDVIGKALLNINEDSYKQYSESYKKILNDMVNKSYKKCIKEIENKEIEYKINKPNQEYYYSQLSEDNEDRLFFENEISKIIGVDKDDLFDIFYEIHTYIEFDLVYLFIENMIQIKDFPRKDPNHESRKTLGKFNNAKNKMINTLKELGLNDEANNIEKEIHFKKTHKIKKNYEDMKKEFKELLYHNLVTHTNTAMYRAKKIVRITDYFNS